MSYTTTLLLLSSVAIGAPAPAPRLRQFQPGTYTMLWGTTSYATTFSPDGRYRYHGDGSAYSGTWHWDRRQRILAIEEDQWFTYWIAMEPCTSKGRVIRVWTYNSGTGLKIDQRDHSGTHVEFWRREP